MHILGGLVMAVSVLAVEPGDETLRDALEVDFVTVESLVLPADLPPDLTVDLTIDGGVETVHLQRTSLRAAGFRVRVQDRDGLRDVAPPPVSTYQGSLVGRAGTRVAARLDGGTLTATVMLEDGAKWYVQPLSDVSFAADPDLHVAYTRDDIRPDDHSCGAADHAGDGGLTPPEDGGGAAGATIAAVAFDADYEFYDLNGDSVSATVADIETVMNSVSAIYETELGIGYMISEVVVRTSPQDPYEATYYSDMLSEFRLHWNEHHEDIGRDTAHLMTGRDIDGSVIGVAWGAVICNNQLYAYGVSQSRYTSNFAKRVSLTAHELGHNWSAGHCAEGCSGGDPDCAIMCPCNGGCSGDVTSFGSATINQISNYAAGVSCMGGDVGACCLSDGTCLGGQSSQECSAAGGAYQGTGSLCAEAVCSNSCAADVDADGEVGVQDMVLLVAAWGNSGGAADVDNDGVVGVLDLAELLFQWGPC